MFVSSCAYILDFHVYIWKRNHGQPPWNSSCVRFMISEEYDPLFCAKHAATCGRTTYLAHECPVTHFILCERSAVWNKKMSEPATEKLWSGCSSFCATQESNTTSQCIVRAASLIRQVSAWKALIPSGALPASRFEYLPATRSITSFIIVILV